MDFNWKEFYLQFKHPFGVSSNIRKETLSIFIQLDGWGKTGYGEACLPTYLGEDREGTLLFFEKASSLLKKWDQDLDVENILQLVHQIAPGNYAAKAAIDMALNDLNGKVRGKPFYELAGLKKPEPRSTSFTIGIDAPEKLEQKIIEAASFSILKIKTGTAEDKALINRVRSFTDKALYVDVNQGWTDKHQALDMIHWLKDQGVILVEQPLPVQMREEMRWLTQRSPLPTIADESVKRLNDLEQMNGAFSGVNIKLMKCTGLGEALKMIAYCRKEGIKILLGCMAESSCGTSAMAQLTGLADYIDLDAPLLYINDPFQGVTYQEGQVYIKDAPGIGAAPHDQLR